MKTSAQSIRVDSLTVAYGATTILDRLDLAIAAGDARVLLGPNGSGKSTLFNTMAGTVRARFGRIRIGDTDIAHVSPHVRAKRFIGRSFQIPKLSSELTAAEHLMLAGDASVAGAFGLDGCISQRVVNLTHAERKLLEVATTFALRTPVLLLDEPSAGLDAASKTRLVEHLSTLRATATTLIIEHDMEFIERIGVPVLLLAEGRIALEGNIADVRKFAQARGMYF